MRGTQVILFIATLCLLAPAALGAQTLKATPPSRGLPLMPQMFCEIFYDVAGSQRCDVQGPLQGANELRITMSGAGHVWAFADDNSNADGRQLVDTTCTTSCVKAFALTNSPNVGLYIYTNGALGTSISVAIDRTPN